MNSHLLLYAPVRILTICWGRLATLSVQEKLEAAASINKIIPDKAEVRKGVKLYQTVMTMRNKYVESAVGLSFWDEPDEQRNPYILPVRPDDAPGRISQQSSCFTLHMHEAPPASNPTVTTIQVDASSKEAIREELHRVNINQFTTYYDLDRLSKEIIAGWGC